MTQAFHRERSFFRLLCWLIASVMVSMAVLAIALYEAEQTIERVRRDQIAAERKAATEREDTTREVAALLAAVEVSNAQLRDRGIEPIVTVPQRRLPRSTTTQPESGSTSTVRSQSMPTPSTTSTSTTTTTTTIRCFLELIPGRCVL